MEFQGNTDPRLAMKYDTKEAIYSMTNTRQTCKHTLDTFTSLTLDASAGDAASDRTLFKNNTTHTHTRERPAVRTYDRAPVLYVTRQTEQCSSSSVSASPDLVFLV